MATDEKRSSARFAIRQLVDISTGRETVIEATGVDLSTGGLLCESSECLDSLTPVSIMIDLPLVAGEHLLRCEGFVAHSRMENGKCITGIQFSNLPLENKSMLEEYLSALGSGS